MADKNKKNKYQRLVENYKNTVKEIEKLKKKIRKFSHERIDIVSDDFIDNLESGRWPKLLQAMIAHGYQPEEQEYKKHCGFMWGGSKDEDFLIAVYFELNDHTYVVQYDFAISISPESPENVTDYLCINIESNCEDDFDTEAGEALADQLEALVTPLGRWKEDYPGFQFGFNRKLKPDESYDAFLALLDAIEQNLL